MRNFARTLIRILDGTPIEYGKHHRGQSTVELALMLPIFLLMVTGVVEIGWYTNNYLILLEVTRVGARFGTIQEGATAVFSWEKDLDNRNGTLAPLVVGTAADDPTHPSQRFRDCRNSTDIGFYKIVVCVMLDSMSPLTLSTDTAIPDDIVVSVVSFNQILPQADYAANATAQAFVAASQGTLGDTAQLIVTGRYPSNANECESVSEHDPFDVDNSGAIGIYEVDATRTRLLSDMSELTGAPDLYDTANELQRGFSWTGKHVIEGTACIGSEWGLADIEATINLLGFGLTSTERESFAPTGAMVLVEIFWRHDVLLDLPGISTMAGLLNPTGNGSEIQLWAAFPIPSAEVDFDLTQ
ncbi:MAG: TadE family protein [Phototrophicaceae bacterium]